MATKLINKSIYSTDSPNVKDHLVKRGLAKSFLSRQDKKASIDRVRHTILKADVYSYDYSWIIEKIILFFPFYNV